MSDKLPTSDSFHIPSELMEFVKRDTYSLLIKGNAGTGKTTLALTLLRALNIREGFQYISTRISPSQLYLYYPWLEQFFGARKKSQLPDLIENDVDADSLSFIDARLDEPVSLFERLTNQLMDNKSPMIIVDSWDTIGYFMDKEALMNNARVLQTWRERAKAKMILISEDLSAPTFDFIADGIIDLRQRHHNDRLLREIFISKLRGVRINRPSYVYTLDHSIFHSYEPYNPSEFAISPDSKPMQMSSTSNLLKGSFIKSGNADLDRVIGGGFPLNGIVNVVLDSNVNEKTILAFLSQFISSFLSYGNSVLYQRSDQTNPEYVSNYLKACLQITKKQLDKLFFLVDLQRKTAPGKRAEKTHLSLYDATKTIKKKNPGKMLLSVISTESLGQYGDANDEGKGIDLLNLLKSISDLTIVVSHGHKSDISHYISRNSDVSMRFLEINGTLFMQSEIPWSHLCALMVDRSHGYPRILFDPVV
ncbi:MAG: hypothetical protein EPO62_02445 [Candidatus Nitrosotenuis sp.]|nr:MAG: hypothetical protein EPO62_02445 [Candidatus Nitrosotenuis sp.]